MKLRILITGITAIAPLLFAPQVAEATFLYTGGPYVQNFDGLQAAPVIATLGTGDPTVGNTTETDPNFIAIRAPSTPSSALPLNDGTAATDGFYSFGTAGDRALGSRTTGITDQFLGLEFQNTSGRTFTEFTTRFDLEVYTGVLTGGSDVNFGYLITSARLADADLANLANYVPNINVGGFAAPPFSNPLTFGTNTRTATGISWAPGQFLYLRFNDSPTADTRGIGIDNLNFVATPEPTTALVGGLLLGVAGLARRRRSSDLAAA